MSSTTSTNPADKMRNRAALIELIGGYMAAHALALAAELKVADVIGDGVCPSAELAQATGTHEPSLRRMLRMLAAVGVTTEPQPGHFGLTEVGAQLRTDVPDSLYAFTRVFCSEVFVRSWQRLDHSIRTGEPAFRQVFGREVYGYLAEQPELSALFNEAMGQESHIAVEPFVAGYDFGGARTVVDLGGGDGTLMSAILAANPHLRGIVFDSPSGVAQARSVLAEAGVADRCEVRAGDFFQAIPTGGDVYVIKSVFQDWDDKAATEILRTCRAHMPDGATLLIVGSVLPETGTPEEKVMFFTDVNMLVAAGGQERTESEFRAMLAECGFRVDAVTRRAAGPLSVIKATPAP